ncbi:ABC transporter permease [Cohnella lubricantis]|uniref:ABC transporter permease n=1 Tax=Cohnella lubricantis TaxID=2163172 RepID=A0A841TBD3_9BACL|nr:ABC transporter permease [Cohnella lubricantis]MBB6677335.1 ABC transporter permease [Cohnella lubricantis]
MFKRLSFRPPGETIAGDSVPMWRDVLRRLVTNKLAMSGVVFLVLLGVMAIIGPMISPHDYFTNNLDRTNEPPSADYWFGTDNLGRDLFSRLWMGARISLVVGLAAAAIDLIFGVIYGGIMGYAGGRTDEMMNKVSEILYSIPYLLVVILLLVVMEPSMWTIILALSVTGWINMSWIVRGQIKQLKNQEYVLAARSMGASGARMLFKHLIPNTLGPIIVTLTLTVPSAIFSEAFLSFLGLGVQSPAASWGTMINDSLAGWTLFPWQMMFPAALLCLTMLAFNVFGDGLRDAFDPKLKK